MSIDRIRTIAGVAGTIAIIATVIIFLYDSGRIGPWKATAKKLKGG